MATDERPPVESLAIDEREIEPEGEGHREADEVRQPEQARDLTGEAGPPYEANQAVRGRDANPGGSTEPHATLSTSDQSQPGELEVRPNITDEPIPGGTV